MKIELQHMNRKLAVLLFFQIFNPHIWKFYMCISFSSYKQQIRIPNFYNDFFVNLLFDYFYQVNTVDSGNSKLGFVTNFVY